jgi:hypothetical protein
VNRIKDNPAAKRACRNFRQNVVLPNKEDKVSITGILMLDTEHGWLELHPVTKITVLHWGLQVDRNIAGVVLFLGRHSLCHLNGQPVGEANEILVAHSASCG